MTNTIRITTVDSYALAGPVGTSAIPVKVRCTRDPAGIPGFTIIGAGAISTNQAKEIAVRVRAAIAASDLAWPAGRVEIVVDAAGAKVQTPALDLPIALAVIGADVGGLLVAGELGLDGRVRAVRGVYQATRMARARGMRGVLVPLACERDACDAVPTEYPVHAMAALWGLAGALAKPLARPATPTRRAPHAPDFAEVRGQEPAIVAVVDALRTGAGLMLSGPPGSGKTMIARRIPGVLPAMTADQVSDVTEVYSALGLSSGSVVDRPFRAPHHTISVAALVGGGTSPRPGELHMASHGVLFLDELPEFSRGAIEALAEALDRMPAASRPLVVAASNSCPCGWHGSTIARCECSAGSVKRWTERVTWGAGKLGISVAVCVRPISMADLRGQPTGETSASIAARISDRGQGFTPA